MGLYGKSEPERIVSDFLRRAARERLYSAHSLGKTSFGRLRGYAPKYPAESVTYMLKLKVTESVKPGASPDPLKGI